MKNQIPEAVMSFSCRQAWKNWKEDSEAGSQRQIMTSKNGFSTREVSLSIFLITEYIIDNDIIENAVEKLRAIIIAEHSRIVSHC